MNRRIRLHDRQGRLISAGYEWTQTRPVINLIFMVLLGLGALGLFMTVASLFKPIKDVPYAIAMAVVCLPAGWFVSRYRFGQCGYILHDAAPIEAPYGLPWPHILKTRLSCTAGDVQSIAMLTNTESSGNPPLHSVVLYLRNGDIVHLTSKDYKFEFAHKVATELTNALDELRAPRVSARY